VRSAPVGSRTSCASSVPRCSFVGRLAIDRFLGPQPLDQVIGREHEIEHVGGRAIAIPLPHPSGASSWVHQPGNKVLLERALDLLGARLGSATAGQRSVA